VGASCEAFDVSKKPAEIHGRPARDQFFSNAYDRLRGVVIRFKALSKSTPPNLLFESEPRWIDDDELGQEHSTLVGLDDRRRFDRLWQTFPHVQIMIILYQC
jgi:hypothetical protein